MDMPPEDLRLFGVRHHGPGSARSLVRALETYAPDAVLIEGPPDANTLLPLASHEGLEPPVALLIHATDESNRAALYPFARFSPEWQAVRFALREQVEVRFIDLPQAYQLAESRDESIDPSVEEPAPVTRSDPLLPMAMAAGYGDAERWWDHLVESRSGNDTAVFIAIHEMMTAVRAQLETPDSPRERHREAWMRKSIRAARTEGFKRIAVVCGAYHTPALANMPAARQDDEVLKGLPKVSTGAAWVPWTYERLAYASGYGAGIESPVWYELLWENRGGLGAQWITRAARLLRAEDVPASSAHVIETCRLADTLAALRERPVPGLIEYKDAVISVLGAGNVHNLRLIQSRWHFDARLGKVPEDFPSAPLQQDLVGLQKRLRLRPAAEEKTLDLDLRQPLDRERSHLLRRLRIIGVQWGKPAPHAARGKGTFHEVWQVLWQPEFAVTLIEASRFGHTVERAAAAMLAHKSAASTRLAELIQLLDDALFADLTDAIQPLIKAIEQCAAAQADTLQLMDAVPPLVEVYRYGNVRDTDVSMVSEILQTLVPRVFIGIVPAAAGIDDDAAGELWQRMSAVQQTLIALASEAFSEDWRATLVRLSTSAATHPLLTGYSSRLLYDARKVEFDELARRLSLALSPGNSPEHGARWLEGFLSGSGMLLIHDDRLRGVLDTWLRGVPEAHFVRILPLLRRSFAKFPSGERRVLGQHLRQAAEHPPAVQVMAAADDFDTNAARALLPVLSLIWGKEPRQ
jgi:hypothetical protein